MRKSDVLMFVLAAGGAVGCATTGPGVGKAVTQNAPEEVSFHWSGSDKPKGSLEATADNGEQFHGRFLDQTQVAQKSRRVFGFTPERWWIGVMVVRPDVLSEAERAQWRNGGVLGTLDGDRGNKMRCRLELANRDVGMKGGSAGACLLNGQHRLDVAFPPVG